MLSPLRRSFEYLPPAEIGCEQIRPGVRVVVPFGNATRVGVVIGHCSKSSLSAERLKRILEVLDSEPLLPQVMMEFLGWASSYFHHPLGDVVLGTLPPPLRRGRGARRSGLRTWRVTHAGAKVDPDSLSRAPRQARLLARLQACPPGLSDQALADEGGAWRAALKLMHERDWVEPYIRSYSPARPATPATTALTLNQAQRDAVEVVGRSTEEFRVFLLDGVTGSGKTEVYLALIDRVLALGRQALVLIPEIGLTPQMVARFHQRSAGSLAVLHSGLTDQQRLDGWLAAREGRASVVIGTRSAVFVPLSRLGLVVVDEEHDPSFKQQEGFRYSARDLAIVRARQSAAPVVLGSATPSLESLSNVIAGRYRDLRLAHRVGGVKPPPIEVIDLRGRRFEDGLSEPLLRAIEERTNRAEQVLLFVNRRGYAPVVLCHQCGWIVDCRRCDAHLVYHRDGGRLRCHHCGAERSLPPRCEACGEPELRAVGLGTQRVVDALRRVFPAARVARMDRDTTRRKGTLESLLDAVHRGAIDILVGTQMLAKGHHFPNVTLVGILDADRGLFGADFRSTERMAQLLVQVAGRSGRGERPGQVLVQTHHPHHPLLRQLMRSGYRAFGEAALGEREAARLPPYSAMALLRAEASRLEPTQVFLNQALLAAESQSNPTVRLLGPVPALMERRAGRHRSQLLVESRNRRALQAMLGNWVPALEALESARRVRWSLDVDPLEIL